MARALALSSRLMAENRLSIMRIAITSACAIALIAAGQPFPL